METLVNLGIGFETAVSAQNLMFCFVGVSLGMFIGVLPGIGSIAAISILLPITFHLEPTTALVMLAGIYYGAQYGGSIAAILLNLPGTPTAAVTCLDGNPLAKQGRAGPVLFIAMLSSFVGGILAIFAIILLSVPLAAAAGSFGAADYFSIMLFGLFAAASLGKGSAIKGMAMVVVGVVLGLVGTDVNSGTLRYTLGIPEFHNGIHLVVVAMGLFGVAEVIHSIRTVERNDATPSKLSFRSLWPTREDLRRCRFSILRGAGVGTLLGTLPGTGSAIAPFLAYALEKKVSRQPDRFGSGAVEGVAAPESANNSAAQAAFIPTLTLGVPGDAVMALMLGALLIHGVVPGPQLIHNSPDVFWGLVVSFFIGNIMLILLNLPLIGMWVRFLKIPYHLLYPPILVFICIGVYSLNHSVFDVMLTGAFGLLGYVMRLCRFDVAPLLLGFILGPLMEEHFRRALLLGRGDVTIFLQKPVSAVVLALIAAAVLYKCRAILTRKFASLSR